MTRYSLPVPVWLKSVFLFALLCACSLSRADNHRWYFSGFGGTNVVVLGSQDPRSGSGFGFAYDTGPARHLRRGSRPGNFVIEAYYDVTRSPGVKSTPPNSSQAWGTIGYGRYTWGFRNTTRGFFDIGWGLQYVSRKSRDLSSKLNSTPVFDLGVEIGRERPGVHLAIRYLHISNAGTVRKNKGENELFFLVQVPF